MYELGSGANFSEERINFNTPSPEALHRLGQSRATINYVAVVLGGIIEMFDRGVSPENIRQSVVEMRIDHTGDLGHGDGDSYQY